MAVLSAAKTEDLVTLLELFPVGKLKEFWPKYKGHKEDVAKAIAEFQTSAEIVEFAKRYFSCCRQHVYVFSHDDEIKKLPTAGTASGERVAEELEKNKGFALFLYWAQFTAIVTQPYEDVELKFLWPFRFNFTKAAATVRLAIMEKKLGAYLNDRKYVAPRKITDEAQLIASMLKSVEGQLAKMDLHKGIKKLWKDNLIDCVRVSYKEPDSTESTTMDEEAGIREKKPALYEKLLKLPLLDAKFKVKSKDLSSATVFFAEPGEGYLGFPRYTEQEGDTDNVVNEIIKHNS